MAHDIAVLMGVKIADGQVLHPVEHLLAQLVEKALGHIGSKLGIRKDGEDREGVQDDQQHDVGNDLGLGGEPIAAPVPVFHNGQNVLDKQRGDGRDYGREKNAPYRQRSQYGIVGK